jgi:hypothetical protein
MSKWLDAVALRITGAVGTMYCALIFAGIAVVATPGLMPAPVTAVATWTAQAFLQLVLLSVIMVGQRLQSESTERLIRETHDAVLEELADIRSIAAEIRAIAVAIHLEVADDEGEK